MANKETFELPIESLRAPKWMFKGNTTADEIAQFRAKPHHGRKKGDIVRISTEEPLYSPKGLRIDGKRAKIMEFKDNNIAIIKLI